MKIPDQATVLEQIDQEERRVSQLETQLAARKIPFTERTEPAHAEDVFERLDLLKQRASVLGAILAYSPATQPASNAASATAAGSPGFVAVNGGDKTTTSEDLSPETRAELQRRFNRCQSERLARIKPRKHEPEELPSATERCLAAKLGITLPAQERPLTWTEKCRAARVGNDNSNDK